MRRFLACISVLMVASLAAAGPYVFIVHEDSEGVQSVAGKAKLRKPLAKRAVKFEKDGDEMVRWHCVVSKAQYDAGWDALDTAVKDAQRDLGMAELSNSSVQKNRALRALSEATRKAINELRVQSGTNAISKAAWRQRVKDEYRGR